jgi:hypothetical protein
MTNKEARRQLSAILARHGNCPTYWETNSGDEGVLDGKYIEEYLDERPDDEEEWLVDTGDGHINPVDSIELTVISKKGRKGVAQLPENCPSILPPSAYFAVVLCVNDCCEYGEDWIDE